MERHISNRCSYYTGLNCEQSLSFFRFSEGSTLARERLAAKTRATRARAWSFACLARFARLYGIAFRVGTKRYLGIRYIACEQALHLVDIVKRGRARGDAKAGAFLGPSRLASLAQIGELARRLSGLA